MERRGLGRRRLLRRRATEHLGPVQTGGQIDDAYFAYGSAPGRRSITISFDGRRCAVPVGRHGVWAFVRIRTDPQGRGFPAPAP